jgi:SAM-dependent methyltransferase
MHEHLPGSITDDGMTPAEFRRSQLGRRPDIGRLAKRLAKLLRANGATGPVLDVGFGVGIALRELALALPELEFHAVDLDPLMAGFAREETADLPNVTIHVADVQRGLPFPDGHFGLVHTQDTWHHLTEPGAALAELRRLVRPGGLFYFADVDPTVPLARAFLTLYAPLRRVRFRLPIWEAARHSLLSAAPWAQVRARVFEAGFEPLAEGAERIRRTLLVRKCP